MTFGERPGIWRTAFSMPPIEINLGGDATGPLPANVEMAQACESQLDGVLSKAVAYVAKHIAQASAISGAPEIEWIDFGLSNYGEHQEFELFFSDHATYVLWAVRFGLQTDPQTRAMRLFPVGFSRRSW
jgi:hypothetical protein